MTQPNYTHDPADCHVCGMHATGIGLSGRRPEDTRWLCVECALIVDRVRDVRRMDPYELKARAGGMEAAGPLVEEWGSDLGEWSEEQVLRFCGTVWKGCADRIRELIRQGDAPF